MDKPSYDVKTEGDLIVVTLGGSQTIASLSAMREAVEPLTSKDNPKDVLLTILGTGIPRVSAIPTAMRLVQEVPFRKCAVFVKKPSPISVAKGIASSSKQSDRIKLFRSEEDARAWLYDKETPADKPTKDDRYELHEENGIIVLDTKSVLNADMLQNILLDAQPLIAKKKKPVKVLLRALGSGPPNPEGIVASIEFMRRTPNIKVATFTKSPDRIFASKESLEAVNKFENFKLFTKEDDARAWLNG